MKRLALGALLAVCGICRADVPAPEPALGWAARYIMVTSQLEAQRVAIVQAIMQDSRIRTPAMLDMLAEELWTIRAQKLPAKKTGFQIIRVLTNGPNPARYRTVLESLGHYFNENGTAEYLSAYKRDYKNEVADQYVPGTIDLPAMRREFTQAALESQPTPTQAQALADLPTNASMDELFARAGKPACVVSRGISVYDVVVVEVRQLWFYYRGIGRVTYDWQRDSGWHQHLVVLDPMAFESLMPYRSQATALGMPDDETVSMIQLASGNPSSIKASAQDVHGRPRASLEYLDTAAEILLQNPVAANGAASDAYSWLCNVLAHHGGKRYAGVLARLAREAIDPKFKRYAGQSIEQRSGMSVAPYRPGAVSLAAQAKKYPSMYPQMTLIRGLL